MADAINTPAEEWRAIPGFPYYEASSLGRVRSLDRIQTVLNRWGKHMSRRLRGKVLALKPHTHGYLKVTTAGYVDLFVHRAVAMAFHGLPPSRKHEAAHLNGNRADNRPTNIVWATHLENEKHKISHGTTSVGEKNGLSILVESDVKSIIERYARGESARYLSIEFKVSTATILSIIAGKTWKHVDSPHRDAAKLMARQNIDAGRDDANRKKALAALHRKSGKTNGKKLHGSDRVAKSFGDHPLSAEQQETSG